MISSQMSMRTLRDRGRVGTVSHDSARLGNVVAEGKANRVSECRDHGAILVRRDSAEGFYVAVALSIPLCVYESECL